MRSCGRRTEPGNGTKRVKDLNSGSDSSSPFDFGKLDGRLFFSAFDDETWPRAVAHGRDRERHPALQEHQS